METKEWRRVLLADPCAYCGQPSEQVDHIHPRHRPGSQDDASNLIGACQFCNGSKSGHSLLGFLAGAAVGHGRRFEFPPGTQEQWEREKEAEAQARAAEKLSQDRFDWIYVEVIRRRRHQRKHGTAAEPREMPEHLRLATTA